MKLKVFKNTLSKHYENYDSWMLNSEILSKTFAGESFGLLFFHSSICKVLCYKFPICFSPHVEFPNRSFFLAIGYVVAFTPGCLSISLWFCRLRAAVD